MNKIEKLLNELCPDGVEFKDLGDVLDYEQPGKYLVNSTNYDNSYKTPVLTAGQTFILGYTDEEDGIYQASKENPVIIFDDFTTAFKWVDFQFKAKSSAMKMLTSKNVEEYNLRYVFYAMSCLTYSPQDHARQWIQTYSKIQIPIPPIEIQKEIVKILDTFTLLEAELEAELEARKKQYEYYRDDLLSFEDYNIVKLENITEIFLGLTYTPKYVEKGVKFISAQNTSSDKLDLSNVKYISEEEYTNSTSNAKPRRGDVLFTRVGSNLGHPVIVDTDEPLCIFVSLGFLRPNKEKVLNSYLKHWMNTEIFWEQVRKNVHGSAKVNLNTGWLRKFEIALPDLEKQQEIVAILDKFDALVNDISVGLPAELKARRQQYEYYRNKLLTFKVLEK